MNVDLGFLFMATWKPGNSFVDYDPYNLENRDISPTDIILLPNTEYRLIFGYPFTRNLGYKLSIKSTGMSRKTFIGFVVRKYRQIYENPEKFGSITKGHNLEDLILHTLYINGSTLSLGIDNSRGLWIC